MELDYEKHGKIVAIIETVITVILGIWYLAQLIFFIVVFAAASAAIPPTPVTAKPVSFGNSFYGGTNYANGEQTAGATPDVNDVLNVAIGIAIAIFVIFLILYLVNVLLLCILWKGVNNKESGKCTGWYITQAVFCGLGLCLFFGIFFFGASAWYYVIGAIYFSYRVYSIHIIRCFAALVTNNVGNVHSV